jgi:hypothetical protein
LRLSPPCLSLPGASILDRETTEKAGELFGKDPAWTIGTGSFVLQNWDPGWGMSPQTDRWQGAPRCEGLDPPLHDRRGGESDCCLNAAGWMS